jgi:hypothetical protein
LGGKAVLLVALGSIALGAISGGASAAGGGVVLVDLVANQHDVVGKVRVSSSGGTLAVEFILRGGDGWCLRETHLAVAISPSGIPQRNGNPVPGRFPFKTEHDCVPAFAYSVPVDWPAGTRVAVAAHAVVEVPGGPGAVADVLPATASMYVTYPYSGAPSYVGPVVSGGGVLDGAHSGWCVDTAHVILEFHSYTVAVHSTSGPLPVGLVDHPENLDLADWLLAQRFVGATSASGLGTYTYGDVQRAIWMIVEDTVVDDGLGDYSQARADEIAGRARAEGEGFAPGCGDVFGVLLQPVGASGPTVAQVLLAETTYAALGVPCEPASGTAWGAGSAFPGHNWATYIEYVL